MRANGMKLASRLKILKTFKVKSIVFYYLLFQKKYIDGMSM